MTDFLTSKVFLVGRLILGIGLAAAGALAFLPAPTHLLWMVALGITEWGHWLTLLALTLLILGGFGISRNGTLSAVGLAGALLCLVSACFTVTPVLRGVLIARELPSQLERSFGMTEAARIDDSAKKATPLVLSNLFKGVGVPAIQPTSVIYRKLESQELSLDLYQPSSSQRGSNQRVGVLVVHGGGWQSGDSREFAALNHELAGRGYLVAAINYRLAPQHKFPAALEDVKQGIAYLKAHAADLGLDGNRLVLLGRSAGGQLALLAAYAGDPAVRGVIAFYAPPDLRFSYTFPANPAVLDSQGLLRSYLGSDPDHLPSTYLAASPFYFVSSTTPPTLLIHGGRDELLGEEQSERLAVRLAAYGRQQFLLTLPWATHGCDINFSGPCGQLSTYAIERFITAVTK
ncbi:MAG: alpha/beta hydrolase [Nitrospirota bacterium]